MVVPYGIYIEDYSALEEETLQIAHIDLIEESLLRKDRSKGIIRFKAKLCGGVASCSESKTRLNVEHLSAARIIIIFPCGADQKLFANRHRVEILFPVINPILCFAVRNKQYG